ncbi:MAG: flippase-like domain-containing protein [Thermoleophilia bacterium]|nr:flippase-like domain-containing protein [Thermoleophilia bacterium]
MRRVVVALALGGLILGLLFAIPPLRQVLRTIGQMSPSWIAAAISLELASCAGFVVIFRLCFAPVPPHQARRLAWTEMASGALLPAGGVGGLAVGGWLLHLSGMSTRAIVQRSSAFFFLTSAVNVVAMIAAGVLLATGVSAGPADFPRAALPILAGCLVVGIVLALSRRRGRWTARPGGPAWINDLVEGARTAESAIRRPSWRLLGAVGYLGFDIAVLWATFAAIGDRLSPAPLILAYVVGYLANLIPIPGGVGVLDGGLVGMLVIYGISPIDAAAAVLVYHAIVFWVRTLGGLVGFALLRRELPTGAAPRR